GQQISRSIRCTNLRRPILPRFTGAFRRVSGLRRRPSSGPDSYLLHRRLRRPRPKILSATSKKTENQGFKMDGLVVAHILFWLRGSGKFTLLGLSVSYLSGTESSDGQFGKYSQDDVDALRALADDSGVVDFLFTNEWPVGVTNRAAESDIPTEVRWGVFYAREPYLNVDSSHVTRFLGLAQVGNKNKQNSKTISIVGDGLRKEKTLWFLKKVTSLASFSNTSLSFCWFNSISRDYAEPLNKVATYTTTVKEGSSGKPVVVAAAPPRSKDQERALKPVRKVRFVLDNDEDLRDIC
ncbi:unnamed protein product, partial [Brassica oleracea var. botrytis]